MNARAFAQALKVEIETNQFDQRHVDVSALKGRFADKNLVCVAILSPKLELPVARE